MRPSPTAGGTPSTSIAHGARIARASAVLLGPRRTSRRDIFARASRAGGCGAPLSTRPRGNRVRACERMPRRWSRRRSSWIVSCSTRSSPLPDSSSGLGQSRRPHRRRAIERTVGSSPSRRPLDTGSRPSSRSGRALRRARSPGSRSIDSTMTRSRCSSCSPPRTRGSRRARSVWRNTVRGYGGSALGRAAPLARRSVASQPDPVRTHDRRPA